jgi:hypothetical protein
MSNNITIYFFIKFTVKAIEFIEITIVKCSIDEKSRLYITSPSRGRN